MSSKMDGPSPSTQYTFDVNKSRLFKKNNHNFINVLGEKQLNSLENVSLLDIFMSNDNIIEPHYHQNAAELVYCISGAITVSVMNSFTKQFHHYPLEAGQVANVPQGWWHYIVATADDTHFLGVFDAPTPEMILGSDLLASTPADIMARTYCLDENQWENAVAPIKPATFIGPPKDCKSTTNNAPATKKCALNQYAGQMHPYTHQTPYDPQYFGL